MNCPLRILHLEDDRFDAELLKRLLSHEGLVQEWVRVESSAEFMAALKDHQFDLILSDYTLPSFNGMDALILVRQHFPDTPFIFVSGTIDEDVAVESLKRGAADYVFKNRLSRLAPAVKRALRDVEDRAENRRAEEAMRESERKYRQVFESMNEAAFVIDLPSGRVLDANQRAESLLGLARAEIIGAKHQRFTNPERFEKYRETLAEVLETSKRLEVECEIIRKDGKVIPVLVRASRLELYGHQLILCLCSDISARKLAQGKLREQEKLLDLFSEAVVVCELDGRIRVWNDAAVNLYGWPREEALEKKAGELLFHDVAEFDAARNLLLKQRHWEGDLHQVNRDHHEMLVRGRWTIVQDDQGEPKSVLMVNEAAHEPEINRMHARNGGMHVHPMR